MSRLYFSMMRSNRRNSIIFVIYSVLVLPAVIGFFTAPTFGQVEKAKLPLLNPDAGGSLPVGRFAPELGCWFLMSFDDVSESGYREFFDTIIPQTGFNTLSTSTRIDSEVTNEKFHDMIKTATTYAREKYGVGILLDLDIRMARRAFEEKYPDDLQERLILQEMPINGDSQFPMVISFSAEALHDHYTYGSVPYLVRSGRFVKGWIYAKNERGEVLPKSICNVSGAVVIKSDSVEQIDILLPNSPNTATDSPLYFCVAVAFGYLTPDIFSDRLPEFESEILQQYSDIPLMGVCKDEWGFPPCFDGCPDKNAFWYSKAMTDKYTEKNEGRSLEDDCLLMFRPQSQQEARRCETIDDFNRLCFERNVFIETSYFSTMKKVFGPTSFGATHPTWWPWPDSREFTKNQLSWWKAPRDYAQTDESTPYFCRTSIAKGTNTVWYNMFYSGSPDEYAAEIWGAVLAGGRINLHPLLPAAGPYDSNHGYQMLSIFDEGMKEGRERIRLLDLITHSPVDSPVGLVFGHFGAMNWARPEYDKVATTAITLCNTVAYNGFPVDMIPSSQADTDLWTLGETGYLKYGVQEYPLLLFFGKTDSDRADFNTLQQRLDRTKTKLIEVPADSNADEIQAIAQSATQYLHSIEIKPQTAWYVASPWGNFPMARPPRLGKGRYVDGTIVFISAEKNRAGDEINLAEELLLDAPGQPTVTANAQGLIAFRFDAAGSLNALAAGGLNHFCGGGLELQLDERTDLAVWKDDAGQWQGVIQSENNEIPQKLQTGDHPIRWQFLQKK